MAGKTLAGLAHLGAPLIGEGPGDMGSPHVHTHSTVGELPCSRCVRGGKEGRPPTPGPPPELPANRIVESSILTHPLESRRHSCGNHHRLPYSVYSLTHRYLLKRKEADMPSGYD